MKQISLWAENTVPPVFPKLSGTHRCDIAVAGGGLTGLTTALLLCRAGARVCVVEADALGSGTSGRTTAKITYQHGTALSRLSDEKAQAYVQANMAGLSLIESLIEEFDIECGFEHVPACVYARNDTEEQAVVDELKAYERLGIKSKFTAQTQLPFPVRCALFLENQAQFHPLKYLYALAAKLADKGAEIFEHSAVLELDRDAHGVRLITAGGVLHAKTAVLATGYPLVEFPGLFFLRIHQERSYLIAAKKDAPGPQALFVSAGSPKHSVRAFDAGGTHWLLAGGFGHKTGQESDDTGLEPLNSFLIKNFPDAKAYCGWSAQDCVTLDGLPYVGCLHKKGPRVYTATGYAKWGMTNSAAAALMIADDCSGKETIEPDIRAHFSPLRVAPAASAKGFAEQTACTVRTFVAGHTGLAEGSTDDVGKGEGAVCRLDGQAAAVGRSKDGKLHVFKARCTHLGCPLEYNAQAGSFDCQCHGSRFDLEGKVLNGPAKQPLEPV